MTASPETRPGELSPELITVPGGWFLMGCDQGRPDERPVHRVHLRPFRAARLPVTNRDYARCLADVSAGAVAPRFWRDLRFNAPEQPVVGVMWAAAIAYCHWLAAQTGRGFRLPTEAEWECAALGGAEGLLYPWGDVLPEVVPGVSLAEASMDRPAPVGSGPANALGLRDMGWNIHEWCSDWYAPDYYTRAPADDPRGPAQGTRRASRGGAWRHQVKVNRCAARSSIPPEFAYNDYGFRVFAEVE